MTTHGATFLKGNYELPSRGEPVRLSRERWEMLRDSGPPEFISCGRPEDWTSITIASPREIDGVIFLPAEYVPRDAGPSPEAYEACKRYLALPASEPWGHSLS